MSGAFGYYCNNRHRLGFRYLVHTRLSEETFPPRQLDRSHYGGDEIAFRDERLAGTGQRVARGLCRMSRARLCDIPNELHERPVSGTQAIIVIDELVDAGSEIVR